MEENFTKLKFLDLRENKLTEMPGFVLPSLEYLDISNNNGGKFDKCAESW